MRRMRGWHAAWLALLALTAAAGPVPPDTEASIEARVEALDNPGIVVGVVSPDGAAFSGYGHTHLPNSPAPDADTVFEVGSITKVFTALLLAQAVAEDDGPTLDTPVAALLPETVGVPEPGGEPITLRMLASHRSGLPRLPDNLDPATPTNPYADYTVDGLYDFLGRCTIEEEEPAYAYSNLGYGLLGHALALRAGRGYPDLLRERVTGPLKLIDTVVTPGSGQRRRLAQGHKGPVPAAAWDMPVLTGAGGLHSTARDLAQFLEHFLGLRTSPLADALAATLEPQGEADDEKVEACLGWHRITSAAGPIYWQNGGTGGFHGFLAFAPEQQRGVVVLSNATDPIDDIGFHLLDPGIPLRPPFKQYPVREAWMKACAGRYRLAPGVMLVAEVVHGILSARLDGQPQYPVYPASDTRFAFRAIPVQLDFETDGAGAVTAVTLHHDGYEERAPRVDD